jgi:hypothetical protein
LAVPIAYMAGPDAYRMVPNAYRFVSVFREAARASGGARAIAAATS